MSSTGNVMYKLLKNSMWLILFIFATFVICRRRPSVVCLSVCNVRAPYSGNWNFRPCFYAIWYLGHPDLSIKILRRSSQGNPSVGGVKHKSGSRI